MRSRIESPPPPERLAAPRRASPVRIGRGDPRVLLGPQAATGLRQGQAPVVCRQVPRHELLDPHGKSHAPPPGSSPEEKELRGRRCAPGPDRRDDAGHVGLRHPAGPGIQGLRLRSGRPFEAESPEEAVRLQGAPTEELAQTSLDHATEHLHLPETIPPVQEAFSEEGILDGAGPDLGNPEGVAVDLHGAAQALDRPCPLQGTRPDAQPVDSGGQGQKKEKKGDPEERDDRSHPGLEHEPRRTGRQPAPTVRLPAPGQSRPPDLPRPPLPRRSGRSRRECRRPPALPASSRRGRCIGAGSPASPPHPGWVP